MVPSCPVSRCQVSRLQSPLSILESRFSVTRQSLAWFHSYLTDRAQVFTTRSSQTFPIPLTPGIPHGSDLGSKMFLSYTENTTPIFSTHTVLYHLLADDTQSHDHTSVWEVPSLAANPSLILCRWPCTCTLLFYCSLIPPRQSSSCSAHVTIWLVCLMIAVP